MRKGFAAAVIAAFLGIIFLFAQGPVQKVRLWDTNLSHSLLFQWNENDVAGRTLNFLVDGASRSLSIFGDTRVEQDYRIAATPTFAGLYLQSSTAAPFLNMTNESGTERDPVHRWLVGATPAVKFTFGLDDSDSDAFKWCNTSTLVDTIEGGTGWGNYLFVEDYGNDRNKQHLPDDLTYLSQVASIGAKWVCTDGANYYVTVPGDHQVKKYCVSDNALLWTIGDVQGSGDNQFNDPAGIATDGVHIYIADKGNTRIKKHLCTTGAYVAKLGTAGTALGQFITPTGIATDGVHIYITEGSPGAAPLLKKHLCSTLAGVSQISADGHLDSTNCQSIATDGDFLWLINSNNGALNSIFKYTPSLVYVSEYGANGAGDTEFAGPCGIAADKTYLYVADSGNNRIKMHFASNYGFVAKFGSFGAGDANFSNPQGIAAGFLGDARTGKLLVLHQNGSYFDIYPKLSLYNYLVFRENSQAAANYIALKAPTSVTSYTMTWPSAAAGAKKHLFTDANNMLDWGQNTDSDGSPSWVRATLTQAAGTSPFVIASNTVNTNLNSDLWDGYHLPALAVGDILYGDGTTTLAKLADVAVGSYLRSGGVTTAPLWSTLILPNAATAYRLPVATAANTIGELAAVGATGEYLKGNTGAIPSFATLNQAAVAGLTTASGPTFDHIHLTSGQVGFPATQVPSADVNTLDDYEEGTWTPDITFGGAAVGVTYGANNGGYYTKIGNVVTVQGGLWLTSKGSSVGVAALGGLPFTLINDARGYTSASLVLYNVSFANFPQAIIVINTKYMILQEITEAGSATNMDDTNFSNDSYVMINCTYRIAE